MFKVFEGLIADMGLSIGDISYSDATIFLRSLGFDKPGLYKMFSGNNPARFENAEQAKETDERLLRIYSKYSHPIVIDNRGSLKRKLKRVVDAIVEALGEPKLEKESAFIIKCDVAELLRTLELERKEPVLIDQFYTDNPGERYRRITYPGGVHRTYIHTEKFSTPKPSERMELENHVTVSEYIFAENNRNKSLAMVSKSRYAYVVKIGTEYYTLEIDEYLDGFPKGFIRVEIEYGKFKPDIKELFASLRVADVSGRKDLSNASIAAGTIPAAFFKKFPKAA